MPQQSSSYVEEIKAAVRGCVALVLGQRDAPSYFDFSQRGLVGSLLAVVIAIALAAFGPLIAGARLPPGAATQSVLINVVLFAAQALTAWIALRQMRRPDGFVPYLVASNWVTFTTAVLLLLSTFLGPLGVVILVVVVVMAIATFINIGRLVVTLTPLQIGLLFLSQAVGVFLALGVVAMMLPPPPLPA